MRYFGLVGHLLVIMASWNAFSGQGYRLNGDRVPPLPSTARSSSYNAGSSPAGFSSTARSSSDNGGSSNPRQPDNPVTETLNPDLTDEQCEQLKQKLSDLQTMAASWLETLPDSEIHTRERVTEFCYQVVMTTTGIEAGSFPTSDAATSAQILGLEYAELHTIMRTGSSDETNEWGEYAELRRDKGDHTDTFDKQDEAFEPTERVPNFGEFGATTDEEVEAPKTPPTRVRARSPEVVSATGTSRRLRTKTRFEKGPCPNETRAGQDLD